jgi:hypothetical protein
MATSRYKDSTNDFLLMWKLLGNLCAQYMARHTQVEQHNDWIRLCPIHPGRGLRNPSCMRSHKETGCRKLTPLLVFRRAPTLQNSRLWHIALDNA